ncbi:Bromodomain-containing protein 7 [Papilio machaon]|uniref:Bromodomain-containing protein 7 n=1 Tax=Papilio machaon TaxID=76193 RepID=A0A0N1IPM5_PAPMA|nr:Bromodomain-containing protein 7 [Papilio machaon]
MEHSANDESKEFEEKSKKRKRRRREIDMIKLSDDDETDDEVSGKKMIRRMSPVPNSPASHREPRSCVLKSDFKLMCNNAMKYNKPGTVYHKAARRLLHAGLKQLTPHKLRPLGDILTYMYEIPIRELGFDIGKMDVVSTQCGYPQWRAGCVHVQVGMSGAACIEAALPPADHWSSVNGQRPLARHKVLKRNSPIKSGGSEAEAVSDGGLERPDADSGDCGDSLKIQMEAAREQHRKRLAKKAFPRMDSEGKTTLCLVTSTVEGGAGAGGEERPPTLAQYIGKLTQGTGTLHSTYTPTLHVSVAELCVMCAMCAAPREDRRNLAKCVKPLNYGPFGSYAPAYDGTFATLTKDETHLVYHTLPYEMGQGNEELLRFAPDSPWTAIYDMEAMFPERRAQPEPAPTSDDNQELSKVKVDVEELRSLAALGIDVDFLTDIEEDLAAAQHDYGISAALRHTHELILKLEKEQRERLSQPPPWHLSLCARAGAAERAAARALAGWLRGMLARVPPRHVAPTHALRKALGVTLEHLDTPLAVDDFELELPEGREVREVREASDPESRHSVSNTPLAVDDFELELPEGREVREVREASDPESRHSVSSQ